MTGHRMRYSAVDTNRTASASERPHTKPSHDHSLALAVLISLVLRQG